MAGRQIHARTWGVQVLGTPSITAPTGIPVLIPHAAERVVAFLALHRRPVRRTVLATTLWPDASESRARAYLRSALWRLGEAGSVVEATAVSLWLTEGTVVDVDALEEAGALALSGEPLEPPDICLLTTELLVGWDEDWVGLERERLRQLALHILDALVADAVREGRCGQAVDFALRAVAIDGYREASHASLMRALHASGDPAGALGHFREVSRTLRSELGLDPSARLRSVMEEILPPASARPALSTALAGPRVAISGTA